MENSDAEENLLIPGGEQVVTAHDPATSSVLPITPENTATAQRRSLPWIGAIPRTSFGVMAVVNEDGYLVPVCTANDLLRACKIIWRASEHWS